MAKARPKTYTMITISNFTGEAKCYIHCYPQQKWDYSFNGDKAEMHYKNLDLSIPKTDFEKYFREGE